MALLHADWFRGPFVPMAPNEPPHVFVARIRARERRVPFRRWRPVWQVQLFAPPPLLCDEPGAVIHLSAYSSLIRRSTAVEEAKQKAREVPGFYRVRVIDVGTGDVFFDHGPVPGSVYSA